jgi:hypothetical protein
MANLFVAAALLSGILAVSGCAGLYPGMETYGYGGDAGYPAYGDAQSYPLEAVIGGLFGQAVQPCYQPQPYAVYDNTVVYDYQPVQPAPGGYASPPPGRWLDRRHPHQEERFRTGPAPRPLTPGEARRLSREQARTRGTAERLHADAGLNHRERAHVNALQPGSSRDLYRPGHNGSHAAAPAPSRSPGPARSLAQVRPAGPPPGAAAQPHRDKARQTGGHSQSNHGRPSRHDGG